MTRLIATTVSARFALVSPYAYSATLAPPDPAQIIRPGEDNRVAFKLIRDGKTYYVLLYDNGSGVAPRNHDQPLAIQFDLKPKPVAFNAKDIATLTSGPGGTATITDRNGGVYTGPRDHLHIYVCYATRVCTQEDFLFRGGHMIGVWLDTDLTLRPVKPAVVNGFMRGFEDAPTFLLRQDFLETDFFSADRIEVSSGEEATRLYNILWSAQNYSRSVAEDFNARKEAERVASVKAAHDQVLAETAAMRKSAKIGTDTNCGTIFDIRLPMVGVQTINGIQYLRLEELYSPGQVCSFENGKYIPPNL